MTRDEVLRRYPRIVAHMICESLGYFTPLAAANALLAYKLDLPFHCEMYMWMAQSFNDDKVREVGRNFLERAIRNRHNHTGYMADFKLAMTAVQAELEGCGPKLASWF